MKKKMQEELNPASRRNSCRNWFIHNTRQKKGGLKKKVNEKPHLEGNRLKLE